MASKTASDVEHVPVRERSFSAPTQVVEQQSWLERTLKPNKVTARYPIKGSPLLYATCTFGSLGDALFGYHVWLAGQSSLHIPIYKDYGGADGTTDSINPAITGISVACLQASAAVGALVAGRLGDIIGRKKCVRIGGFIYFFSAFIQMFAPGFVTFVTGRTIQGIGVGFLYVTVPFIQTEIAAPHRRGLMVGIEYACLIAGYMMSCWVDYGFNFLLSEKISWQGPFIIQIVLSFLWVVMPFFLPETPRWLAKNGFWKESLQIISDLHSRGDTQAEHVQKVFLEIQDAVKYEENLGKSRNVHPIPQAHNCRHYAPNVRPTQRNQHHFLYLPSTLASAGFGNRKPLLNTAINALPYTGATVVTWYLADRWGRKPLLILGGLGMAGLLGVVCTFTEADLAIHTKAYGQYAFVMLYNIVYGFTWGPMPWLLPAEIFPLRGRSKGMALTTTSN